MMDMFRSQTVSVLQRPQTSNRAIATIFYQPFVSQVDPRHEKNCFLHMRKQMRR